MDLRITLFSVFLLSLTACSKPQQTDRTVLGGELANSESDIAQSTVALGFYQNGKFKSNCTGTIISKDIVLTAAHCVKAYEMDDIDVIVYFGNEYRTHNESLERTTISWIYHRGYDRISDQNGMFLTAYNDVAVIKIQGTLPEHSKPVSLIAADREVPKGSDLILAGWGATQDDPFTPSINLQFTTVKLFKYWNTHLITDQREKKGACSGDSGGPAYAFNDQQELILVGVTRGPHAQSFDCSEFGEYTNITANLDFILEATSDLRGETPNIDFNIGQTADESKKQDPLPQTKAGLIQGVNLLNTPQTELRLTLKCASEVF